MKIKKQFLVSFLALFTGFNFSCGAEGSLDSDETISTDYPPANSGSGTTDSTDQTQSSNEDNDDAQPPNNSQDQQDNQQESDADSCGDKLKESYVTNQNAEQPPPFHGTIWVDADLVRDQDPTAYKGMVYRNKDYRTMFDRRTNSFQQTQAHLFDATFGTNKKIEIQVNVEFSEQESRVQAEKYARVIGQIPGFLLADVQTVWIHKGNHGFGGGNNNLLIHTDMGESYIDDGILAETFIHEATHTSIDGSHQHEEVWGLAQRVDNHWMSSYAKDNPVREDLAESMLPYLAYRFRAERISPQLKSLIETTMPNRIKYFDCLNLSMKTVE